MANVELRGLEEVQRNLRQFGINADAELDKAVRATTLAVQAQAITSISQGTKSGETYQKYTPRRTHTASAPGEAPATDTGRLVGSIETRMGNLEGVVFTRLQYGRNLEFGTLDMQPRPWLFPAIESQRLAWEIRLQRAMNGAERSIGR